MQALQARLRGDLVEYRRLSAAAVAAPRPYLYQHLCAESGRSPSITAVGDGGGDAAGGLCGFELSFL
jgi:hypothetical protein